jgi:hypothetical protein
MSTEACIPSEAQWDDVVAAMTETHCGLCHGETADYGAPYGLTDYQDLLLGTAGERPIDGMVDRVADSTMPPAGQPRLPHDVLDTMVLWASCGEEHPDYGAGVDVSRPVFQAPSNASEPWDSIDMTADNFPVGPDVLNLYQCFTIEIPIDETRYIKRFEPIVHESAVLHHIVFLRDTEHSYSPGSAPCVGMPTNSDFLYAWAPGGGPIEFPDGGIATEQGEQFILQIHYNNGAAIEDIQDSSGVRIYLDEPVGTEYGMFSPGPLNLEIPPNAVTTETGRCILEEDMTVLTGMPHMHELGSEFHSSVVREDGTLESLIDLTGWSFEMQLFYELNMDLSAGDELLTSCVYDNPYDNTVVGGERTEDEMCFNFMYVTPPPANRYCTEVENESFNYTPGECASDPTGETIQMIEGSYVEGIPEEKAGGEIIPGFYVPQDYTIWLPEGVPIGEIDNDLSYLYLQGQINLTEGRMNLDIGLQGNITLTGGIELQEEAAVSFSGDWEYGSEENHITLIPDCGEGTEPVTFNYETDGDVISFISSSVSNGIDFMSEGVWVRVDDPIE